MFGILFICVPYMCPIFMPCHGVELTTDRQNGRFKAGFGSLLRHISAFSAYFMFGIAFAHI